MVAEIVISANFSDANSRILRALQRTRSKTPRCSFPTCEISRLTRLRPWVPNAKRRWSLAACGITAKVGRASADSFDASRHLRDRRYKPRPF